MEKARTNWSHFLIFFSLCLHACDECACAHAVLRVGPRLLFKRLLLAGSGVTLCSLEGRCVCAQGAYVTWGPLALWLMGLVIAGARPHGTFEIEVTCSAHTAMWKSDTGEQDT